MGELLTTSLPPIPIQCLTSINSIDKHPGLCTFAKYFQDYFSFLGYVLSRLQHVKKGEMKLDCC